MKPIYLRIFKTLLCGAVLFASSSYAETAIAVRSLETVTSKTATIGQIVRFEVAEGLDKLPQKTPVTAMVSEVYRGSRMMTPGRLKIDILSAVLPDGRKVLLRGYASAIPDEGSARLLCPGLICAMKNGKEGIIKEGQTFSTLVVE